MQANQQPTKIQEAFAINGARNAIPVPSQASTTPGAASFNDGFPSVTMQPVSAGGIPPSGKDFNGILYAITSVLQWECAGGFFTFDATFAQANGGYPKGAILQSAGTNDLWLNTTDGNTSNPDATDGSAANWVSLAAYGIGAVTGLTNTNVTLTPQQHSKPIITLSGALTGNVQIIFPQAQKRWLIVNNTTGGYTVTAKTASGTGVAVPQGQTTDVYGDGTNINIVGSAATPRNIQSISASVASNALTLTLNPTQLDFRNPTLNNGTPNTRTVLNPVSLTVPAGATLGAPNAQTARLVVLAIDNAGTVELALVNLAGGVNLDETTLINTTAISASSNTNTVIYSTTARTGVPFRVVGFVDVNETTAGTYAAAPTTVQGVGGQALAALQSLGYGQTLQSVSRTSGTTYYNTTGRPILVIVATQNSGVSQGLSANVAGLAYSGAVAANNTFVLTFIVPPGAYYSVTVTQGAMGSWLELR